ncbi:hypothetical protein G6O67_003489 [Ophiocordyceps sinensis]|uniref:GH16 domain-containing protein n=1 Tax=Ophiocordyceps sinensis TaxID=72228 RepID=A0A8H4PWH1_9HYPO|nr:hypothetical protein G6O67_003489 [Ophiocordyceps sinensis]
MALNLVTAVAVLLAWTGGTSAESFQLAERIDKDNFFDKFTFSTIKDPNHGFVNYVSVGKARKNDMVKIQDNGDIYLGVDNTTTLDHEREPGRDSFRVQSKAVYKHGLFVARFTHMPAPVCGSWPAFWTFGSGTWPEAGEIDIYEGWNLNTYNKPTLHAGRAAEIGQCTLNGTKQGAKVLAEDCDNFGATHDRNQGCQTEETEETENSIWGSPEGGTQALFWTSEEIKIYTWPHGKEPDNVHDDEIDTDAWSATTPSLHLKTCDIDRAFQPQTIVLDVDFCGIPAGTTFWTKPDHKGESTCYDTTKVPTCDKYVAENPEAFNEVYFQFKDIRHFRVKREAQSSTPVTSATTSSLAKSLASRSGNEFKEYSLELNYLFTGHRVFPPASRQGRLLDSFCQPSGGK